MRLAFVFFSLSFVLCCCAFVEGDQVRFFTCDQPRARFSGRGEGCQRGAAQAGSEDHVQSDYARRHFGLETQ